MMPQVWAWIADVRQWWWARRAVYGMSHADVLSPSAHRYWMSRIRIERINEDREEA